MPPASSITLASPDRESEQNSAALGGSRTLRERRRCGVVPRGRNLERGPLQPNERLSHGTTVEIKLGRDAKIDYPGIVEELETSCCYVRTPIYLTHEGESSQSRRLIQRELLPSSDRSECISFEEDFIQGYLRPADRGEIRILAHRLYLGSFRNFGVEGVVNCDHLSTTFSRDSVQADPIWEKFTQRLDHMIEDLNPQNLNIFEGSLETRMRSYERFVTAKLLGDSGPDLDWLASHLLGLVTEEYRNREQWEVLGKTVTLRFLRASLEAVTRVLGRFRGWLRGHGWFAKLTGHDKLWEENKLPLVLLGVLFLLFFSLFLGEAFYSLQEYSLQEYALQEKPLWISLPSGLLDLCFAEVALVWAWVALKQRVRRLAATRRIRAVFPRYAPATVDASKGRALRNIILGLMGLSLGAILLVSGLLYLSKHLEETDRESEEPRPGSGAAPWHLLVPGALGLGLLYVGLGRLTQRKLYRGELTSAEQRLLTEVEWEMSRHGRYREYYDREYKERHPRKFGDRRRSQQRLPTFLAAIALAGLALALYLLPDYGAAGSYAERYGPTRVEGEEWTTGRPGAAPLPREVAIKMFAKFDRSKGYIRHDTANAIYLSGKQLDWADQEPPGVLQSNFPVDLPAQLQPFRASSDIKKLREVAKHIDKEFVWGSFEPEAFDRHPIDTLKRTRTAPCGVANTYAALLLHEMSVKNVRAAFGTLSGVGHMWLEVQARTGEWQRYDVSPSRIASELKGSLPYTSGASQFLGFVAYLRGAQRGWTTSETFWRDAFKVEAWILKDRPWLLLGTLSGQLIFVSGTLFLLLGLRQLLLKTLSGSNVDAPGRMIDSGVEIECVKLRVIRGVPICLEERDSLSYSGGKVLLSRKLFSSFSSPQLVALRSRSLTGSMGQSPFSMTASAPTSTAMTRTAVRRSSTTTLTQGAS